MRLPVEFRYQIMGMYLVLILLQGLNSQKRDRQSIQEQSSGWRSLRGRSKWWTLGTEWKPYHWDRILSHFPGLG